MSEEIPTTMRAIEISEPGDADVLRITDLPVPEPGAEDVLIEVRGAGVNRPDVMQRTGMYPPPPGAPDTPGLEVAGTIRAIGPKAAGVQVGEGRDVVAPIDQP